MFNLNKLWYIKLIFDDGWRTFQHANVHADWNNGPKSSSPTSEKNDSAKWTNKYQADCGKLQGHKSGSVKWLNGNYI